MNQHRKNSSVGLTVEKLVFFCFAMKCFFTFIFNQIHSVHKKAITPTTKREENTSKQVQPDLKTMLVVFIGMTIMQLWKCGITMCNSESTLPQTCSSNFESQKKEVVHQMVVPVIRTASQHNTLWSSFCCKKWIARFQLSVPANRLPWYSMCFNCLARLPADPVVMDLILHRATFEKLTWTPRLSWSKLGTRNGAWEVKGGTLYWPHYPPSADWCLENIGLAPYAQYAYRRGKRIVIFCYCYNIKCWTYYIFILSYYRIYETETVEVYIANTFFMTSL